MRRSRPPASAGGERQPAPVPPFRLCHASRKFCADAGADPTHLVLEVTEGLVIEDIHDTIAKMEELNELGIHFSIDDFGTGYSSLAYLKRMPLHELKIDRTFVQDVPQDPNDVALVETILSVARHLNLSVVAEGVETEAQFAFLKSRQCGVFQGYLFDRPLPWEDFRAALARLISDFARTQALEAVENFIQFAPGRFDRAEIERRAAGFALADDAASTWRG
jgi:EAL domain-containing protein (putative c-di-GMP-specific phosphodiesterase class I)